MAIGSVVEWLECCNCDRDRLDLKPTRAILLCLGKDTLWHFPLLVGLGKQF